MMCIDLTNNVERIRHVFCTVFSTVIIEGGMTANFYVAQTIDFCAQRREIYYSLGLQLE